jgi:hypothetical protein
MPYLGTNNILTEDARKSIPYSDPFHDLPIPDRLLWRKLGLYTSAKLSMAMCEKSYVGWQKSVGSWICIYVSVESFSQVFVTRWETHDGLLTIVYYWIGNQQT